MKSVLLNEQGYTADGEGDNILVPRGLIGAACSAIDKQRQATKILEALRYYTMSAVAMPADVQNRITELEARNNELQADAERLALAIKSEAQYCFHWRDESLKKGDSDRAMRHEERGLRLMAHIDAAKGGVVKHG